MDQTEDYNKEVGKRVRAFREAKGLTQMDLLYTFGSKSAGNSPDNKANLISMIEHGKRRLTEKNIKKLAEKYDVLPGYFRLETDYMTEEERLLADVDYAWTLSDIRIKHFQMIMKERGYKIESKGDQCTITDQNKKFASIGLDDLFILFQDFESHLAFQIQLMINRQTEATKRMEMNKKQLSLGEGK